jgi:hypothetical protein
VQAFVRAVNLNVKENLRDATGQADGWPTFAFFAKVGSTILARLGFLLLALAAGKSSPVTSFAARVRRWPAIWVQRGTCAGAGAMDSE